jgi:trigger factor
MQVSFENTSTIGRRLTVHIPVEQVQSEIEERTKVFTRTAKLPGFRPGKIPEHIIQKKYGVQIQQEAIGRVIETSLPLAFEQCKLQPASRPVVEKVENKTGEPLKYIVSVEIFPEVALPDFSEIEIDYYETEITEKEIEDTLEKLQKQFANWSSVERAAEMNDKVIIDYTSTAEGKPYKDNSGQNIPVQIGSKLFLAGFEEGLIGAKAGETRVLELSFPKDWRNEKLAGLTGKFEVKIKSVSEQQLPPLDDAFAKKIGAKEGTLEAIRLQVRESLNKQIEHAMKERHKQGIFNLFLEKTKFELPKSLVENEIALLHEDLHRQMGEENHGGGCGHNVQEMEAEANKRVKLSLILRKIAEQEAITVNKERVKEKISNIAGTYQDPKEIEAMYHQSKELNANIQNSVIVEQIVEHLLQKVKRKPKVVSMEDLFKQNV